MKVLLLGSGAREHALAWKIAQSPALTTLWCSPGNPGIEAVCPLVREARDPAAAVALAKELGAELVVVGPEAPLVAGVADALRAAGIAVFGPSRAAAQLEGSKAFAKALMAEAGVPTARFEVFTDLQAAAARAGAWGAVVVKADGLAAGKGVVVANDGDEARAAVLELGKLPAGATLVLEERLTGPELSVIALCDGKRYALLPPAQDHKQLLDGDLGPNTGGMGTYAPARLLSTAALEEVGRTVIAPVLAAMERRGTPFVGALFAGLMLTPDGPRVLEFNCRFGDPETQVLMLQLDADLLPLLAQCARGKLEVQRLPEKPGAAVAVVLAAAGYPGTPRGGDVIFGLSTPAPAGVQRFHAGTKRHGDQVVTAGGRVLSLCAQAADLSSARALAYAETKTVHFEGMQLRTDIGARKQG